jgi:phosphoserine phosphatase
VTESAIVKALTGLTFVAGIRDLIETSHDRGFEIVVLSDNLTLFVEAFLEFAEIRQNSF